MDTNLLEILVRRLIEGNQPAVSDGVVITGMFIAFLGPLVSSVALYFSVKAAHHSAKTAEETGKIHVAVNSERTATLEQIKTLREDILKLTTENVVLEQSSRKRRR